MYVRAIKMLTFVLSIIYFFGVSIQTNPFSYYPDDKYQDIMIRMDQVNADNCLLKSWEELTLPPDTIGQIPVFNDLHKVPWVANRSSLLHMHNMALNRGFFYSWILQRLNTTQTFDKLPGLHYYYLSAAADVSANPGIINGSAVLFDTHCQYANWLDNLYFNITLPLFGPKAWRLDDWNDEFNWLRGEPTNFTVEVTDYGAGPNNNYTAPEYKYNPWIKDRERQIGFIPDYDKSNDQEHQMDFLIREMSANGSETKQSYNFYGPPQPGVKEKFQPVRFTRPYFDCKRSNKWIVTSVAPVVDVMMRYVPEDNKNLRYPKIVAISTMDIDFLRLDYNPCPPSLGNDMHYLAGTARCKPTTICEPLFHFGFQRGGYQCHCQPGFRLPFYQNGPFQGVDIERATEEEYKYGFDCLEVQWNHVVPTDDIIKDDYNYNKKRKKRSADSLSDYQIDVFEKSADNDVTKWFNSHKAQIQREQYKKSNIINLGSKFKPKYTHNKKTDENMIVNPVTVKPDQSNEEPKRLKLVSRHSKPDVLKNIAERETQFRQQHEHPLNRRKRSLDYFGRLSGFEAHKLPKIDYIMNLVVNISGTNCKNYKIDDLHLPGEVGYGSEKYFEMQGRVALRLAHFLSAYYQNNIRNEKYGNLKPGTTIDEEHLYSEVFANIMSDRYIMNSGVFYDRQKFFDNNDKRKDLFAPFAYKEKLTNQAYMATDLGSPFYKSYTENSWFKFLKERWGSNSYGLEKYSAKPWIRSDIAGSQLQRYFHYPLFYYVPRYQDGYWSNPYFDCDGLVKQWLITYSAPFFGRVKSTEQVEFMGVVTISVPLQQLDINQCPSSFYTPNFFKNTATCDYRTTYCAPIEGRHFQLGQYKCECRQGFEYPFADNMWFYLGEQTDKAYRKKMRKEQNRFDTLVCRESNASMIQISMLLTLAVITINFLLNK